MRATVTLDKAILDDLVKETRAKSKASAVSAVINDFLRRRKIETIKSYKGNLEFDRTADEVRHDER